MIPKSLEKRRKELEIRGRIEIIQMKALLKCDLVIKNA